MAFPAAVRSKIIVRSNSAKASITVNSNFPAAVVSMRPIFRILTVTSRSDNSRTIRRPSSAFLAKRSNLQHTNSSPGASLARRSLNLGRSADFPLHCSKMISFSLTPTFLLPHLPCASLFSRSSVVYYSVKKRRQGWENRRRPRCGSSASRTRHHRLFIPPDLQTADFPNSLD